MPADRGSFDYWVISQLTLRGETEALDFERRRHRTGGSSATTSLARTAPGMSGCVTGPTRQDNQAPGLKFFGNVVHDVAGRVGPVTKYYHGIYFASNHLELGWNTVRDGKTCRAIQFHDSGGPNEFDLVVHDNVIHGTVCDGINFATVDPSQGADRRLQQRHLRRRPRARSRGRLVRSTRASTSPTSRTPARRGAATSSSTTTRSTTAARAAAAPPARSPSAPGPVGVRWTTT